jgi:hypothetical protein
MESADHFTKERPSRPIAFFLTAPMMFSTGWFDSSWQLSPIVTAYTK